MSTMGIPVTMHMNMLVPLHGERAAVHLHLPKYLRYKKKVAAKEKLDPSDSKFWSVKVGNKPVIYTDRLMLLDNINFCVQQAGWKKYKSTGVRNVHALVRGNLDIFSSHDTYHKYFNMHPFVYDVDTGEFVAFSSKIQQINPTKVSQEPSSAGVVLFELDKCYVNSGLLKK